MGKRAADVLGSVVLLVFAVPLGLVAAVVSTVTFRAPPFFVQERIGRGGRPFRLVKVRTLAPETPSQLEKSQLVDHEPPAACRALRSHHVDELPQLLQVLSGHMSLVGPRPEMPALHDRLTPEATAARSGVRPGLTGLWQVSTAVRGLISDDPSYDLFYARWRTGRMDLWILWRTLAITLGGRPITSVDEVPRWTWRRQDVVDAEPVAGTDGATTDPAAPPDVGVGDAEVVEAASSPAT